MTETGTVGDTGERVAAVNCGTGVSVGLANVDVGELVSTGIEVGVDVN
jgi:hypothetical protein